MTARQILRCAVPILVICAVLAGPAAAAPDVVDLWQGVSWGEAGSVVVQRFGARLTILPWALDFGDSYTRIVMRDVVVGGVPLIAFFQMDKATDGLKRIQLERQRHGVNPPAFRGVVHGLEQAFGAPDVTCAIAPGPASGYQAATEVAWSRGGNLIRAVFRDTTIEAFEGCLNRYITDGPCGLTGQLLLRISGPAADRSSCPARLPAP